MTQWTRAFTGGSYASNWRVTLDYIITTQDVANNRSYIELRNYVYSTSGVYSQSGAWDGRLYVNGSQVNRNTPSASVSNGWYNLNTWGGWVYHNADGTLYITIGNYVNAPINDAATSHIGWTLPTIPRASQPSLVANPTNIGSNMVINMNRMSGAFTHTVEAYFGSWSTTLATGVATQYTWDTSANASSLYGEVPNANTGNGTIRVHTYNGGTYLGYKDVGMTLNVTGSNPVFADFSYKDTNSVTTTITGNDQYIVQGVSTLEAKVTVANKAVAQNSATMSKYIFDVAGISSESTWLPSADVANVLGVITSATNQILTVTAKDSRANTTAVAKTVNVVPYSVPLVYATAVRQNDFDATTDVHIDGIVSLISVAGVVKNAVDTTTGVSYRYRESGQTWGSWTNRTSSLNTTTGAVTTTDFTLSLDNTKTYDLEVKITDLLNVSTLALIVDQGESIFRVGVDGYAYNKEQPLMPSHVGMIIQSVTLTSSTDVEDLYGGTWVAWGTGRTPVGVDTGQTEFNTVEKTGGHKALQAHTHTGTTTTNGNHAHNYSGSNNNVVTGNRTTRWSDPVDINAGTTSTNGNHNHTFTTDSTGSGSGQNLQPYVTCYFWKRTV